MWKIVAASVLALGVSFAGFVALCMNYFGYIEAYMPVRLAVDSGDMLAKARQRMGPDPDRNTRWVHQADVAFWTVDGGNLAEAASLADEVLAMAPEYKGNWNYGNVLHKANLARGRIALRAGSPRAAATFLLEAGRTPGSPQLDTFGPNMLLAEEMLARGESEAVLAYIEEVRTFWKMDPHATDAWIGLIRRGKVPNFGAHDLY